MELVRFTGDICKLFRAETKVFSFRKGVEGQGKAGCGIVLYLFSEGNCDGGRGGEHFPLCDLR